jgi:hypothetical protein
MRTKKLPKITLGANTYYIDWKKQQLRNVDNPADTMPLTRLLSEAIEIKQKQSNKRKEQQ